MYFGQLSVLHGPFCPVLWTNKLIDWLIEVCHSSAETVCAEGWWCLLIAIPKLGALWSVMSRMTRVPKHDHISRNWRAMRRVRSGRLSAGFTHTHTHTYILHTGTSRKYRYNHILGRAYLCEFIIFDSLDNKFHKAICCACVLTVCMCAAQKNSRSCR